jgi:cysteine-rich repeat protein
MHRSASRSTRLLAAALATTVATSPVAATVHTINVRGDGTFQPKAITIQSGDTVVWVGLRPTDAVARLSTAALAPGGVIDPLAVDGDEVCAVAAEVTPGLIAPDDPAFVATARLYQQAYHGDDDNELTGPGRRGVSGIWVLGPEGGEVSKIEIPSDEAEVVQPGITADQGCAALNDHEDPANDVLVDDDPRTEEVDPFVVKYVYADAQIVSGNDGQVAVENPVVGPDLVTYRLCNAFTLRCDAAGDNCVGADPDPAIPETIPPGTYLNGLLTSTYENPDVTGVVLRFNWKDLQYDGGGFITERWQHLDRELERAIAHGKLVTFDVRAGMFGTPSWIFADYLRADLVDPDPDRAAPWCDEDDECAFTSDVPPGAGQVQDLEFVDHYDEVPPGDGCGSLIRIGAPGDENYRALYRDFIAKLADHVARDTRWWQAVAHVKASGANLRTSEAELPHHCNDDYVNTGEHTTRPKENADLAYRDRVLDVFKTLRGTNHETGACVCNTKVWFDAGYVPQDLYDYYAGVEQEILTSFFGEKSIGYQIIQDGFPRVDAGASFLGDHLYQETLVDAPVAAQPLGCGNGVVNPVLGEQCDDANFDETDGCRSDCTLPYLVDAGFAAEAVCFAPSVTDVGKPEVDEDRTALTVEYCSADSLLDPPGTSYQLALTPLVPLAPPSGDPLVDVPESHLAAHATEDNSGVRYPPSSAQSEQVMDEAGNGRFTAWDTTGDDDRITGKLFVPQHSGIQAFPQEGFELAFRAADSGACDQQRTTIDTVLAGWPAGVSDAVGGKVAAFPIPPEAHASGLGDDNAGCPNAWIVDQGKNRDLAPYTVDPPGPVGEITADIYYPPQLTGFQTTKDVRSIPHVESALFNLVYNTNAVFIELYEDSVWAIGRSRGTGPGAVALDDPAAPVRLAQDLGACTDPLDLSTCPYLVCDPTVSCYSKNLSQWAAELHARRAWMAREYATYLGARYPGLEEPFPRRHAQTLVNVGGTRELHAFINPAHCDPTAIRRGPNPNQPSALGVIWVEP